jgi:hypothetical protein
MSLSDATTNNLPPDDSRPRPTIEARFLEFHRLNPEVYAGLIALCREAKATGRERLGIRTLWEVLRWRLAGTRIGTTDDPSSDYKLNDHYHSRYARLVMQEPDLEGFFEIRTLRTP